MSRCEGPSLFDIFRADEPAPGPAACDPPPSPEAHPGESIDLARAAASIAGLAFPGAIELALLLRERHREGAGPYPSIEEAARDLAGHPRGDEFPREVRRMGAAAVELKAAGLATFRTAPVEGGGPLRGEIVEVRWIAEHCPACIDALLDSLRGARGRASGPIPGPPPAPGAPPY